MTAKGEMPGSATNDKTGKPSGIMRRRPHDGWEAGACSICMLPNEQLLALNLLLADPNQWPKTIFAGIVLPKGALPAGYRLWGAVKIASAWAKEQGLVINHKTMRKHYSNHVVQVPASAAHFAESGMLSESDSRLAHPMLGITPVNFREYYGKGLKLGNKALDMLLARIEKIEKDGGTVPLELLYKAADLGNKLAISAAQLTQRGLELDKEREDELEGFRAGSSPLPSARMGHSRIRVVEGEARPVVDEGRADRLEYNKRAEQEGSPLLPV